MMALALTACAILPRSPPPEIGAPWFYGKYVSARGIPILSSARVSDEALLAARDMAMGMTAHRPDLARWLATNGWRIAIIAEDEAWLDLPENAH